MIDESGPWGSFYTSASTQGKKAKVSAGPERRRVKRSRPARRKRSHDEAAVAPAPPIEIADESAPTVENDLTFEQDDLTVELPGPVEAPAQTITEAEEHPRQRAKGRMPVRRKRSHLEPHEIVARIGGSLIGISGLLIAALYAVANV